MDFLSVSPPPPKKKTFSQGFVQNIANLSIVLHLDSTSHGRGKSCLGPLCSTVTQGHKQLSQWVRNKRHSIKHSIRTRLILAIPAKAVVPPCKRFRMGQALQSPEPSPMVARVPEIRGCSRCATTDASNQEKRRNKNNSPGLPRGSGPAEPGPRGHDMPTSQFEDFTLRLRGEWRKRRTETHGFDLRPPAFSMCPTARGYF